VLAWRKEEFTVPKEAEGGEASEEVRCGCMLARNAGERSRVQRRDVVWPRRHARLRRASVSMKRNPRLCPVMGQALRWDAPAAARLARVVTTPRR